MAVETKGHWLFRAGTGNVIGEDLCLAGVQRRTARGKLVDQRSEHRGELIRRVPVYENVIRIANVAQSLWPSYVDSTVREAALETPDRVLQPGIEQKR
eukprot:9260127-Pyramimonas_sp.AAC.1